MTEVSTSHPKVNRLAERSDRRETIKVPTSGSDAMIPTGKAARPNPSVPMSNPSCALMSGRCGSHFAMIRPSRKKIRRIVAIGDTSGTPRNIQSQKLIFVMK